MGLLQSITSRLSEKADKTIPLEQATRTTIISFASLVSFILYLIFAAIYLINGSYLNAAVLTAGVIITLITFFRLKSSSKTELYANIILLIAGVIILFSVTTGGAFGTGFLWIFPFPIMAIALNGIDKGTRISAVFLVFIIAVTLINLYVPVLPDYELFFSLRLIGTYVVILIITFIYEFVRMRHISTMEKLVAESREESKRKDDFLSKLSHQIRTPLSNITLISTLVDRTKLPADQQDLFDTIIASTNNLVNVVNNIVQISAIDLDESERVEISFNIESTIDNTLTLFKNQHKETLEINSVMAVPKVHFLGNPVRIKQLILNLIENLVKIKPEGKLVLSFDVSLHPESVETSKLDIIITCPPVKISKDDKQNYFIAADELLQSAADVQKNYLDFSIARKIVEHYSGSFNLKSNRDKTTIQLSLILKNDIKSITRAKEPDKDSVQEIIQAPKLQKVEDANILLVEDNAINQKIVILSLKNKVKSIEVASNGKEALDKFGTTKYDIILMDIQMPVMNGIIATKKIRELEASTNTHTPIVAITANALSGDKEACLAAGMNDYVSKPFQVEMLLQKMQNLISGQSA